MTTDLTDRRSTGLRQMIAALALLVVLGSLGFNSGCGKPTTPTSQPLVIFCAASNQAVMEAIRGDYEKAFGTELQVQYGASQTLLAGLEVSKTGDLYLPADSSFVQIARERNMTAEEFPLAQMRAVIVVPKGNPKKIATWEDLLRRRCQHCSRLGRSDRYRQNDETRLAEEGSLG